MSGDRYVLWAATGRSMLAEGHIDIAEQYYRRVLNAPDKMQAQHIMAIVDANIGLSEIYRQRNEYRAAEDCAKLALDIAARENDELQQFFAHCAVAHVAAARQADPEPHYAAAIGVLTPIMKSASNVVSLLHEARYHQQHGNGIQAARFAGLAQAQLRAIGVTVFDAELVNLLHAN